ncbi:MAG: peptidylprolyl isomerase [Actinobacteria bacterium]|nr:peptidylprolyl isomerase [Actinomycetota bacterium]
MGKRSRRKKELHAGSKEKSNGDLKSKLSKRNKIIVVVAAVIVVIAIAAVVVFVVMGVRFDMSKTIASVNGEKIKQKQVDIYIDFLMEQNPSVDLTDDEEGLKALEANIIDSLIVVELLDRYARENNIEVREEEIDEQINKIIENYPSESDFEEDLAGKNIGRDFLRSEIQNQILRTKIFDLITNDISISSEEIENYYNENREILFKVPESIKISHILARISSEDDTEISDKDRKEALDKINYIKEQLDGGELFEEVAKKYSDDEYSAENGGDLGYISRGQTIEEFENAAFLLDAGEVSEVIETVYGFHIIKATDYKEEYIKDFEEVKDAIESFLDNETKMKSWESFVFSLIEAADIEYYTDVESTFSNINGG